MNEGNLLIDQILYNIDQCRTRSSVLKDLPKAAVITWKRVTDTKHITQWTKLTIYVKIVSFLLFKCHIMRNCGCSTLCDFILHVAKESSFNLVIRRFVASPKAGKWFEQLAFILLYTISLNKLSSFNLNPATLWRTVAVIESTFCIHRTVLERYAHSMGSCAH